MMPSALNQRSCCSSTGPVVRSQQSVQQRGCLPGRPRPSGAAVCCRLAQLSRTAATTSVVDASGALDQEARRDRPASTSGAPPTPGPKPSPRSLGPVTAQVLKDQKSCFNSLLEEYEYWVDDAWVEGEIPPELSGTYFRNGPGLIVNTPNCQRHAFDGDGMIISFAFKEGKAFFRNKFVRTKGFLQEQAIGRPVLRGSFTRGAADGSSLFNPLDLNFKNVANTGVLHWAGQLFALWEGGLPHLMDAQTLHTIRETRLGGQVEGNSFAGHYRITREHDGSRRWVAFSTNVSFTGTNITFYEFGENGRAIHTTHHPLASGVDITFVHDLAVTEHYYVVVLGPLAFDAVTFGTKYVTGAASIAECLKYDESRPARVMLFPRPGRPSKRGLSPRVLEVRPFFPFHHVNAYEAEGGTKLVLDTVGWDELRLDSFHETAPRSIYDVEYYNGGCRCEYLRLVADLTTGAVSCNRLMPRTCEFPCLNPESNGRPHRYAWALADMVDHPVLWGPPQAVVKLTLPTPQSPAPSPAPPAPPTPAPNSGGGSGSGGGRGVSTPGPYAGGAPSVVVGGGGAAASPAYTGSGAVATDVWYVGDRKFPPGEPQFVPRPGGKSEDDGWLLVVLHNAATGRGELAILDAAKPSDGPVALVHLPHHLPMGLHGSWTSQYFGPRPGSESFHQHQHQQQRDHHGQQQQQQQHGAGAAHSPSAASNALPIRITGRIRPLSS